MVMVMMGVVVLVVVVVIVCVRDGLREVVCVCSSFCQLCAFFCVCNCGDTV